MNLDNTCNGVVTYCDCNDDCAVTNGNLYQQAMTIAAPLQYEVTAYGCDDTIENNLQIADEMYLDGVEHIVIVTDPSQVDDMETALLESYGDMFESIRVIGKGQKLREQDIASVLNTPAPAAAPAAQPAPAPQAAAAQPIQEPTAGATPGNNQGTVGASIPALIFLKANPPLKGFGELLKQVKAARDRIPGAKIIFHRLGIEKFVIDPQARYDMMFTGKLGPALYGPNGTCGKIDLAISSTGDASKLNTDLLFINSKEDFTVLATKVDPATTKIIAPANMIPTLKNMFPNTVAEEERRKAAGQKEMLFEALQATDVDSTGNHEKIIALASKIAADSLVAGKKRDELKKKAGEGHEESIETLAKDAQENKLEKQTMHDQSMIMMLGIGNLAFKQKDAAKYRDSEKWAGLSSDMKQSLDTLADISGIGLFIDLGKDIRGLLSGKGNKSGDGSKAISGLIDDAQNKKPDPKAEAKKKEAEELAKKAREILELDVESAMKHKDYKEFVSFFDAPSA